MGTVVFHAGMGKAGSSSIQAWLAGDLPTLRERGIELLTARREPADHRFVRLLPYRRGRIHANRLVVHYEVEGADRRALVANFVEQLAAHAARRPVTVITVEAAELLFWRGDAELVDGLNDLGREHTVRVAYYVRPQHTALEAYWRQWGFRSGQPPSQALQERAAALDYLSTYEAVTARAGGFSFEVRPFREDLLVGGNPVTDFARTFLGLDSGELPEQPPWSNRGLPIEVVNALAHAPEGLFWSSLHDNERLDRIKEVLAEVDAPDGPPAVAARRVLQAYCRRRFEPGNARLIEALGWETDAFVPPLEGDLPDEQPELEALDELWRSRASAAELQAFFSALAAAIEPAGQETEPPPGPTPGERAEHAGRGRTGPALPWWRGRERR